MLLRLQVTGFKNLLDVDVRFGPFTCIAGVNGVGKSNLLDAIQLLGALATSSTPEAVAALRGDASQPYSLASIFWQAQTGAEISFSADVLLPPVTVREGIGMFYPGKAPLLHYALRLALESPQRVMIVEESLRQMTPAEIQECSAGFDIARVIAQLTTDTQQTFIVTDTQTGIRQLVEERYDIRRQVGLDQPFRTLLYIAEDDLHPTAYQLKQAM